MIRPVSVDLISGTLVFMQSKQMRLQSWVSVERYLMEVKNAIRNIAGGDVVILSFLFKLKLIV